MFHRMRTSDLGTQKQVSKNIIENIKAFLEIHVFGCYMCALGLHILRECLSKKKKKSFRVGVKTDIWTVTNDVLHAILSKTNRMIVYKNTFKTFCCLPSQSLAKGTFVMFFVSLHFGVDVKILDICYI